MSENITNEIPAGDLNPVPENPKFPEGLRVLVVDDDPTYLKTLSAMLQKCKYQVTQTTNAAEALALLRKNEESYDIVMTDVKMPDMDGFELVKIIGLEMDIPVIMMSVDGDINKVMKGVTCGARDYLVKPIRILELSTIWQHVIRKTMLNTEKSSEEIGTGNLHSRKRRGKSHEKEGASSSKKPRFVWTREVHQKFIDAVNQLDADKVFPKQIVEIMNEPQLTREIVGSHLQKYRIYLKKQKEIMIEERSGNAGQKWNIHEGLREGNGCSSSANGVMTYGDHLSNSQIFGNSQFDEGVMTGHSNQQNFWSPPPGFANFGAGQSGGPSGVFETPYQTLEGPSVVQPFPHNALPGQQDGVDTNYSGFPTSFQANGPYEVPAGQGTHMQQGTHLQQSTHMQRLTDNSYNYNYHQLSSEADKLNTEAK